MRNIVRRTKGEELDAAMAEMPGIEDIDPGSIAYQGKRNGAISTVIDNLSTDEYNELEAEAREFLKKGYPQNIQRRSVNSSV